MSSSVESDTRSPNTVKLYDVQHNSSSVISETNSSLDGGVSSCSGSGGSGSGGSAASGHPRRLPQQSFSLVKLFMKQKSISNEGMCYAMDQSSASECWPASNNSQSEGDSDSYGEHPRHGVAGANAHIRNTVDGGGVDGSGSKKSCCSLTECDCALRTSGGVCENNNGKHAYGAVDNGNGNHDLRTNTTSTTATTTTTTNTTTTTTTSTTDALDEATNNWIRTEEATTDYSTNCFEDSLAEAACRDQLNPRPRRHTLIDEEDEEEEDEEGGSEPSESVEQLSESVSKIEESALDLGASSCASDPSFSSHHGPRDHQLHMRPAPAPTRRSLNNNNSIEERSSVLRSAATQAPAQLTNRSVQTSGNFELIENPDGSSLLKILDPSLTPRLGKILGEKAKRPLYIFYPNYTLPDLGFLREQQKDPDMAKVFLMPQKYTVKAPEKPAAPGTGPRLAAGRRGPRPFSCNDMEALRKKGFSHIQDWESLTVLLPRECRQILAELPELGPHLKAARDERTPLFCVSPPQPRRPRPASCGDWPAAATTLPHDVVAGLDPKSTASSASSTATQPSSGYRGSSTLLTDSGCQPAPATTAQYNPLFVYRYDSVSSESSLMSGKGSGVPPLPKRSISLPTEPGPVPGGKPAQDTPPRPPLPRGILRKSLEKPSQFNCKVLKNTTNSKRYSMFELGGKGPEYNNDEKAAALLSKRASLQPADYANVTWSPRRMPDKEGARRLAARLQHSEKDIDEREAEEVSGVAEDVAAPGRGFVAARPPTPPRPRRRPEPDPELVAELEAEDELDGDDEGEALPLEELLQLSALSALGPAAAAAAAAADPQQPAAGTGLDAVQMQRLRLQVSKFLLAQQQPDNEPGDSETECRTPHNTPEHHGPGCSCPHGCNGRAGKKSVSFAAERELLLLQQQQQQLHQQQPVPPPPPLAALPIREEGESSPEGLSPQSVEPCRSPQLTPSEAVHRRSLVTAVSDAVEQVICHFSAAQNQAHCARLGDSCASPAVAELALDRLCPALYAALGDGLKPSLDTAFGAIHNSVWQVVEASAQQGPMTKALNELVLRINSEDVLTEGLMKFNAFVFGLLNVRSLDAWLAYLRTRESVLSRHYTPGCSLLAAAASSAPARALVDQLVASLQPLALLPFHLDLLFEARRLHASLRRLEQLSPQAVGSTAHPAGSPPGAARPWTFRKLVRSIQNSLTQSTEEELPPQPPPAWVARPSKTLPAEALLHKLLSEEEVPHHPNCVGPAADPLPDLVESGRGWPVEERPRPRPRSCVDGQGAGAPPGSFSLVTDIASTVRKRWSGIHLGSKLFQAFDRLAAEDTEEEYTDSLEPGPRRGSGSGTSDDCPSEPGALGHGPCPAPAPTPVPVPGSPSPALTSGGKFRRLQMKWEMLSGKEGFPAASVPVASAPTATKDPSPIGGAAPGRSKIPRPVSSPNRPSAIPVPATGVGARHTALSEPARRGPTPAAGAASASKRPGTVGRTSRADRPHPEGGSSARPSSLPYRTPGTTSRATNAPKGAAAATFRRAASSSQGRTRHEQSPAPRFVRTLCHRLPADSGHLSFNEGEHLRLVLEVDANWLLCCRGDRKGLVPRSAVIGAEAA